MPSSLLLTLALLTVSLLCAAAAETEQPKPLPDTPDYPKYPAGLAGYTGMNLDEIAQWTRQPAVRSRIGWRGLYKTGLTRLPNGSLLTCPCHRAEDGKWRLTIFRSQDEGKTWTHVETKGDELLGKEPALVCLHEGAVLLVTSHPHGFRVARSEDGGVTWKTTNIGDGFCMIRNVLEERDGALTLLMSKGTYYNRTAPPSQAWLYRSTDGGATWTEHKTVKAWDDPESMFDEASLTRLPDGRWLAAGRVSGNILIGDTPPPRGLPTAEGDESGDHIILSESKDNGLTWSKPRPFLGYSEVHSHLLPLKDGRLLCTYASYHLPFGVFAVVSEDGGKTWDTQHPIQLAMSLTMYAGWPTSIQLPNGDILTAYAITAYQESEGVQVLTPGKGDTVAEVVRWKPEAKKGSSKR